MSLEDIFGKPIAVYTMAQAIEDGALISAQPTSDQLFSCPVLLTRAAWYDCVAWDEGDDEATGALQNQEGRLWDVIWMTAHAVNQHPDRRFPALVPLEVSLYRIPRVPAVNGWDPQAEPVRLHATLSADDIGSPVIVIGLPGED